MPISVNDIHDKEFSRQAQNGYNVEEVDDFLDALAEQLSQLIRENLVLQGQVSKLQEELGASQASLAAATEQRPDYNEDSYFRNLQSAMRDSLISAQRVADETTSSAKAEASRTVEDARVEAEQTLADVRAEAARLTGDAQKARDAAREEYESLKAAAEQYRASFRQLVEAQLDTLKANDLLFQ